MNDGWHGDGWGGGHWIAAIVMMVLFWGVIAAIVITLVRSGRWSRHDHHAAPPAGSSTHEAERILHERFARGEIDADEYTRRHDLLKERSR
jgi:putative membrane protein